MQAPTLLPDSGWQPQPMTTIAIGGDWAPPADITDLESFRRWARSDSYPRRGWFAYLNGVLWVDLSMEQLYKHNRVKTRITTALDTLTVACNLGDFFSDRVLLSNSRVNLSTEPDGSFCSWEAFRQGRIRMVDGATHGHVELEGAPDMTLEVVSDSSVRKDNELLRELYWRAGVREYWIVDARGPAPLFTLLQFTPGGYVAVTGKDGWLPSAVFGHAFRLIQSTNEIEQALYTLESRPLPSAPARTTP
jgi:Uma2 family endonuclease